MKGRAALERGIAAVRPALAVAGRTGFWFYRRLFRPEYPLVAVEIRGETVGVVRLVREKGRIHLAAAAVLDLPEGAVRLSMVEPNLADRPAFVSTLRSALERAGALGIGRINLVLPDPIARVAILPSAELRGKRRADAEEVLRFRLRKSVPFDIREARLNWNSLPAPTDSTLVGAIARTVIEDYEEACAELGLHAGLIEMAGLALHDAAIQGRPLADRLVVNWDTGYVSIILSRAGAPVLFRSLAGELSAVPSEVAREVASTFLYYRERLNGPGLASAAVRRAGSAPADAVSVLSDPLGLLPEAIDPWTMLEPAPTQTAAPDSLAGALACVLGRAA